MNPARALRAVLAVACAFALIPVVAARAANTCTATTASGSWTSASSWTGCGGTYPGSADTAVIPSGELVDLNAPGSTTSVGSVQVAGGGTLELHSSLSAGSASIGGSPSTQGATLMSPSYSPSTLTVTGALTFGASTVSGLSVVAGSSTTFSASGATSSASTYTSAWSNGATFSQTGGTAAFQAPFVLSGVNPSVSQTALSVTGPSSGVGVSIPGTLALGAGSSIAFHPTGASASTSSPFMLTLGGVSGSATATTTYDQGYAPATGDQVNLVSAPNGGLSALTATNTATQSYAASATSLVVTKLAGPPAAPLSLSFGGPSPALPTIGQSFTVAFTTNATSVTCTQDGTALPASACAPSGATLAAPGAFTTALAVTATLNGVTKTYTDTVPIPWLPATVTLTPDPSGDARWILDPSKIGLHPGDIDCSKLSYPYNAGDGVFYGYGFTPDPLDGGTSEDDSAADSCWSGDPGFADDLFLSATAAGTYEYVFTMNNGEAFHVYATTSGSIGGSDPSDSADLTTGAPMRCAPQTGAQAYLWNVNGTYTTTSGPSLPAAKVPANATVSCGALVDHGLASGFTVLVTGTARVTATASVGELDDLTSITIEHFAASARRAHPRRHVTLTLRAGRRATLQVLAYNTHLATRASGHGSRIRYRPAYRTTITVHRGVNRIGFGRKLATRGFVFIVRGVRHRHHRTVYGKSLRVS